MIFRAKEALLWDKAKGMTPSFSAMENLTTENIEQAISVMGDLNVSRVIVTDGEGIVLYDTNPELELNCRRDELNRSLQGWDTFYCRYESGALYSHAVVPVVARERVLGCVYIYD